MDDSLFTRCYYYSPNATRSPAYNKSVSLMDLRLQCARLFVPLLSQTIFTPAVYEFLLKSGQLNQNYIYHKHVNSIKYRIFRQFASKYSNFGEFDFM